MADSAGRYDDYGQAADTFADADYAAYERYVETRQHAHDRGYVDAFIHDKAPDSGYADDDQRPQVSTRVLAYYTGYGEGKFAKRENRLPNQKDKEL